MSKPEWTDLPEWANYMAQDACGEWWCYPTKPELCTGEWDTLYPAKSGQRLSVTNWKESLQERPQEVKAVVKSATAISIEHFFEHKTPSWTLYLARDPDGELYAYNQRPIFSKELGHFTFAEDVPLEDRRADFLMDNFPRFTEDPEDAVIGRYTDA